MHLLYTGLGIRHENIKRGKTIINTCLRTYSKFQQKIFESESREMNLGQSYISSLTIP